MSKTLKYTWNLYFVLTSYGPNAIFLYTNKRHILQYDINDIIYCEHVLRRKNMKRKIAAVALCAVVVSSMVAPAVSVKAADKENLL